MAYGIFLYVEINSEPRVEKVSSINLHKASLR
jgi:hypothetical protein